MDFVNNINLVRRAGFGVFAGLPQIPHLLHTVVARAVYLQHVEGAAAGDFPHARVVLRKIHLGAAGAVESLGVNARDGGFAGAARPDEQVGVGDALLVDGIGEGLGDVLLTHHIHQNLSPRRYFRAMT